MEAYDDDSLSNSLAKYKLKTGVVLRPDDEGARKKVIPQTKLIPETKFSPKPEKELEDTKETLRGNIMAFAEEAVKKKEEIRQVGGFIAFMLVSFRL